MKRCVHAGRYSTSQRPGPLAARQDAEGTWPLRVCEVGLLGHFSSGMGTLTSGLFVYTALSVHKSSLFPPTSK